MKFKEEKDWNDEIDKCKTRDEFMKLKREMLEAQLIVQLIAAEMPLIQALAITNLLPKLGQVSLGEGVKMLLTEINKMVFEMFGVEIHVPEEDVNMMLQQIMGICRQN